MSHSRLLQAMQYPITELVSGLAWTIWPNSGPLDKRARGEVGREGTSGEDFLTPNKRDKTGNHPLPFCFLCTLKMSGCDFWDFHRYIPLELSQIRVKWKSEKHQVLMMPLSYCVNNPSAGASLAVQWLRICLPMQGTRVQALVWKDPTCRGATKPVRHNY